MRNSYQTLKVLSEGIYKEKGSKFIAYAVYCDNEEDAKKYLLEWKKLHHQARHLCYAYRFGAEGNVLRANDDGEPNNSAGAPILGQIHSFDLTNVLIGVVRYFGGTKLGVGGLITAYKSAAKDAIEQNEIYNKIRTETFELNFQYDMMPKIMNILKLNSVNIMQSDFQTNCIIKFSIELSNVEKIKNELENLSDINILSLGIN